MCWWTISVRLRASAGRSERTLDVVGAFVAPKPTNEHYVLFRSYLDARHPEGGMADMSSLDFAMMVEDTHIDTVLTEYRVRSGTGDQPGSGPLLAVCLTDRLADGLSLVYSFYDPDIARRSLGSYVILDHIEKARRLGLPHVYLGYWVEGSKKMGYKAELPAPGAPRPARLGAGGAVAFAGAAQPRHFRVGFEWSQGEPQGTCLGVLSLKTKSLVILVRIPSYSALTSMG